MRLRAIIVYRFRIRTIFLLFNSFHFFSFSSFFVFHFFQLLFFSFEFLYFSLTQWCFAGWWHAACFSSFPSNKKKNKTRPSRIYVYKSFYVHSYIYAFILNACVHMQSIAEPSKVHKIIYINKWRKIVHLAVFHSFSAPQLHPATATTLHNSRRTHFHFHPHSTNASSFSIQEH